VVDDIDTNLEIVEAYLQDRGYQVDCASSGLDAIQMLANTQYDLILMDVQMPIMDGVTATKHIRALAAPICDIPIIAMTGNVMHERPLWQADRTHEVIQLQGEGNAQRAARSAPAPAAARLVC